MNEHPEEWRLTAQIKPEYCPAVLLHGHGAGQCRLKPGHDGDHDVTCWTCVEDGDSSQLTWAEPGNGITRWPGCVSDHAHLSHG